ncbi:hypothetical protein [Nonomuraea deserti]|uniref:hypothetical protein n=1 Tax=Nonomuraea deserti TaxID=1848322 RepID=UPI001404B811|nr:hypothetical protein [Nonomuraea deserti]
MGDLARVGAAAMAVAARPMRRRSSARAPEKVRATRMPISRTVTRNLPRRVV